MDSAKNKKNEIAYANNAAYGIYFCIECGELSFLRKPLNKNAHFYHSRYNEKCSLSVKGNENFFNSNQIIENAINILKENYSNRWLEAIDCLIQNECLSFLYGKEWAINPVNLYINNHLENIEPSVFYEFLHILSGINNIKAFKLLLSYVNFSLLNEEEREDIEQYSLEKYLHSVEIINYIINENEINDYQKFKLFCHVPENKIYLLKNSTIYNIIRDIDYLLKKDNIERYKYFMKKYKDIIHLKNMVLYKINLVRNDPSYKLYRAINGIKKNIYDELFDYLTNESSDLQNSSDQGYRPFQAFFKKENAK
jgi:hypothetical protein